VTVAALGVAFVNLHASFQMTIKDVSPESVMAVACVPVSTIHAVATVATLGHCTPVDVDASIILRHGPISLAGLQECNFAVWKAVQRETWVANKILLFSEHAMQRKALSLVPHRLLVAILAMRVVRIYVPLLVVAAVAGVHVDIPIVEIVVRAFTVMPGLQRSSFHVPFLVVTAMAGVHVDILVIIIVIQALVVIFSLQLLSVHVPLLIGTIVA
jgi:hypothetical protein